MPFQVGGVSLHDDYQHTGSAARDVVDGVAGIGPGGNVLAPGPDLELTRDGSENIEIVERTSGNIVFRWTRVGVNDFECRVNCGGVACIIQNDSMKDVVNGIAALDGGGNVSAPGSAIVLTRDGSDFIYFMERTSSEICGYIDRNGAGDFIWIVRTAAGDKVIQHEGMKDVVSGIAGLDANKLLDPVVHAVGLEEYSNHLGVIDDFLTTTIAGAGTVTADSTNHEIDLFGGAAGVGEAVLRTKDSWTLGTKPFIMNVLIQNIVNGDASRSGSYIGLRNTWDSFHANTVAFFHAGDNTWDVVVGDGVSNTTTAIDPIVNGDLISIIATSSEIRFFKNGGLIHTVSTYIPTVLLNAGAHARNFFGATGAGRQFSVDMMSMRRYL